jgi:hypothetical protein
MDTVFHIAAAHFSIVLLRKIGSLLRNKGAVIARD